MAVVALSRFLSQPVSDEVVKLFSYESNSLKKAREKAAGTEMLNLHVLLDLVSSCSVAFHTLQLFHALDKYANTKYGSGLQQLDTDDLITLQEKALFYRKLLGAARLVITLAGSDKVAELTETEQSAIQEAAQIFGQVAQMRGCDYKIECPADDIPEELREEIGTKTQPFLTLKASLDTSDEYIAYLNTFANQMAKLCKSIQKDGCAKQ